MDLRFYSLVFANLAPVAGVIFFGWDAIGLLLLYWSENVILGVITLSKIIISGLAKGAWHIVSTLFNAAFFIFHYGLFCLVHGTLIFVVTDAMMEPDPAELLSIVWTHIAGQKWLLWNLVLLAAFHAFEFIGHWLLSGAWRKADPQVEMFMPYGRIVVIHVALLGGGYLAQILGQPTIVLAALAILKLVFEVASQLPDDDVKSGGTAIAKPPA